MINPNNPYQRTVVLQILTTSEGIQVKVIYKAGTEEAEYPDYVLTKIDRVSLRDEIILPTMKKLNVVAENAVWEVLEDPLGQPEDEGLKELMQDCVTRVLDAGSSMFRRLREDPDFVKVLAKVEALPDGSTLSIQTDCAYLPWEIMYPLNFNRERDTWTEAKFPVGQLWGNRFVIEVLHADHNEDYKPPYQEHRNGRAFISLNLNPEIDTRFPGPFKPAGSHEEFYKSHLAGSKLGDLHTNSAEVKEVLLADVNNPTVIYLYCHGSNSNPYYDNQDERLQLDATTFIDPDFIDNDHPFMRGPIVFLNSCASGSYSPLSFSNFLTKFKSRRALGLVATSFMMPATFASGFGQRLLADYIGGVFIGDALWELRSGLLKKGNPLGMFYSLQCPMHITAPA